VIAERAASPRGARPRRGADGRARREAWGSGAGGEDDLITAEDFRDFTFANAVRRWGTQNPTFFEGTAIAKAAAAVLAEGAQPTAPVA